jgi:hypothetical protein
MRSGPLLLLIAVCLLGAAACDDETAAGDGDGGAADAAISCGVVPSDGVSCAALECPAACDQASSCNRFCGGGDCYTCSAGTWTRIFYNCVGQVCQADGGLPADAGGTVDALIPGNG